MQLSYCNSYLGILLCPCLIRGGGDLGLRRGEAMLGDYPPPSSVSLEGRREVGTTRRGGRGLLIVRKTSFLLNPCKARSNIFFQRRLSLMTQFFSFSNFLFPDSFAAWRFSGSSRVWGQEIISLNVLIHGLELLGQEDINVPLPHAFQPLGSIADSSQFIQFLKTLPPGRSFHLSILQRWT